MKILIKNQQKIVKLSQQKNREIVKKILEILKVDKRTEVSILFADDKFIKKLNGRYRGIDKPTDVLAFCLQKGKEELEFPQVGEDNVLGDIIISTETAQRQADSLNHSIEKELTVLLIHGLLHLLGYDHEKEEDYKIMHEKENELLVNINFGR
ncbi:MAG: rRNA maturation RNase YbeY [Candidatus Caldatribacteriota bacterium]|nr:rRNA maturation RNase YbeY [Candidatus Caldatribacteriota bacterium]